LETLYSCNDRNPKNSNNNHHVCCNNEFSNKNEEGNDNQFFSSPSDVTLVFKDIHCKLNEIVKSRSEKDIKITVLPDFFIDRIIRISDIQTLTDAMDKKIKVGGGSIRGLDSVDIKGGNAVNVAYCLARLGAKVDLFTVADKVGCSVLNAVFKKFGPQINLHIKNGKHGLTTIFEFTTTSFSVSNVMLSDVGENSNFGPESIESTDDDLMSVLGSSSGVVLTNWASNLRGTDLLRYVFENSKNSLHFLDPADISDRRMEFVKDLKNNSKLIDFLSINENEYLQIICALSKTRDMPHYNCDNLNPATPLNLGKSVLFLSNFFNVNMCVHTSMGSVWSNGKNAVFVKSITPSKINIVSGAGDSWDSAFLFGHLLNFTNEEKLCFANLFAFLYLENSYNDPPSLQDIVNYIHDNYF
jgi:ribokinase